jgi:hypothetical protein
VAGGGDEDIIFDADAADAGEVDAGLDGDDHAGFEGGGAETGEGEGFVDIAAKTVTEAVAEVVAVAGFGDDVAGGFVDFFAVDAGFDGGDAGELSVEDHFVDFAHFCGDVAEEEAAGEVGAVAAEAGAPVEEHGHVGGELGVGGAVVGEGAVGTEADDGVEGGVEGAAFAHFVAEEAGDFVFGDAGLEGGFDGEEGAFGDADGLFHDGDFVVVLDVARGDAEVGDGFKLDLDAGFFEKVEELGLAFKGHGFGLNGEGFDFEPFDLLGDLVVDGFFAHDGAEPGGFALDLLIIARVAEEEGFVGGEEEVGVVAFEAGEPGDVGETGEEEGVGEFGGLGGGADFGEARGNEGFGSAFGLRGLFRCHEIPPNVNAGGKYKGRQNGGKGFRMAGVAPKRCAGSIA